MSSANSATTGHARNSSTDSNASTSTAPTTPSSTHESPPADMAGLAVIRRKSKTLSFTQYDKYLTLVDRNLKQPKFAHQPPPEPDVAPSIFSVSTRKSYRSIKRSLGGKVPWKKKKPPPPLPVGAPKSVPAGPISPTHICADEGGSSSSCVCCREEFSKAAQALQTLPCGHTYCENCLRIMVNQSRTDESKMPPRCCTQPIPGFTIKAILPREEQFAFLKSVLQFFHAMGSAHLLSELSLSRVHPATQQDRPQTPVRSRLPQVQGTRLYHVQEKRPPAGAGLPRRLGARGRPENGREVGGGDDATSVERWWSYHRAAPT